MSELFGDAIADRPVNFNDFTTEERVALMSSRNQFLPYRDRSGRQVFVGVGNCNYHFDLKLRNKIFMFLHWTASEDIETQEKGIVIIGWFFDEANDYTWEKNIRPGMSRALIDYQKKQNRSLPVRIASWHHYYMDTFHFRFLARLYLYNGDKSFRSIYKVHFGSQTELRYKLCGYGVAADLLPLSSSGTLKFDNHRAFLRMREMKMMSNPKDPKYREIVECPRSVDVVFRKGPAAKHNKGNELYRDMLDEHRLEHFKGDKATKYDITMTIMKEIQSKGGRFLEWKNNAWQVFTNLEDARKKIAAGFKQKNRNYKTESAQELIDAISNAVAIEHDGMDTSNSSKTAEGYNTREREFVFIENTPAKRLKTNVCFGMHFCANSDSEHDTDVQ